MAIAPVAVAVAARPIARDSVAQAYVNGSYTGVPVPVVGLGLSARRHASAVTLKWDATHAGSARTLYEILRSPDGAACRHLSPGAPVCYLDMQTIGFARAATFTDTHARAPATYRVAVGSGIHRQSASLAGQQAGHSREVVPGRLVTIVVPAHDEEDSLRELVGRVLVAVEAIPDIDAELILVDDGSRDATYTLMVALASSDDRVKVVQLSRNFGHQVALTAGIQHAAGDAVVVMDADLQHPPELIGEFVRLWREGYEIVYGVMQQRPEGWFKQASARSFYAILRRLTRVEMPAAAGDFRLVDRVAIDAFLAMRERDRYVRGMFAWLGFRQIGVDYVPVPRSRGQSKYNVTRMVGLALDAIFSFSIYPLRIVLAIGLLVSLVSSFLASSQGSRNTSGSTPFLVGDARRSDDVHRRLSADRPGRDRRIHRPDL